MTDQTTHLFVDTDLGSRPAPVTLAGSSPVALLPAWAPSRETRRPKGLGFIPLVLVDTAALCLSMFIGLSVLSWLRPRGVGAPALEGELIFVPAFLLGLLVHGTYGRHSQRMRPSGGRDFRAIAMSLATGVLIALAVDAIMGPGHRGHRDLKLTVAVALALPAVALIPLMRRALRVLVPALHQRSRVIIAGSGDLAQSLTRRLVRCADIEVIGIVDDDVAGQGILGGLPDLPALCAEHRVDRVIVTLAGSPSPETLDLLRRLEPSTAISLVPRFFQLLSWRSQIEELHGIPLVHVAPAKLSRSAVMAKRAFDILGSVALLLPLLPVGLVIAAAIKLDSPGPVLFRQTRTGHGGRDFAMLKFRTMVAHAETLRADLISYSESDGPNFKMRSDPRVTRVGAWLRRKSLDELPQLLNVLVGDMSLVGPRPFPVAESKRVEGMAACRFTVRPGLTGLWQVSGRNDLSWADMVHLDSVYIASWSFWWDVRILLQTPGCVLKGRGAY